MATNQQQLNKESANQFQDNILLTETGFVSHHTVVSVHSWLSKPRSDNSWFSQLHMYIGMSKSSKASLK